MFVWLRIWRGSPRWLKAVLTGVVAYGLVRRLRRRHEEPGQRPHRKAA
jgi:hypothetical protein